MTPPPLGRTGSLKAQFVRVRELVAWLLKRKNFSLCVVPLAGGLRFELPHWGHIFPGNTREPVTCSE